MEIFYLQINYLWSLAFLKKFINLLKKFIWRANPGTLSHQVWTKIPVNPEPSQTSKKELSAKVVKGLQPLTIFEKSSMSDAWLDFEYPSSLATAAYELKHIE